MFRPPHQLSTLSTQYLRQAAITQCIRSIHPQISLIHTDRSRLIGPRPNPSPKRFLTYFKRLTVADIPDVKTFLKRIGRGALKECEDKILVIPSLTHRAEEQHWSQLFHLNGRKMKEMEIPPRLRRYILFQINKYRYALPCD
jgi:IGR protein motif